MHLQASINTPYIIVRVQGKILNLRNEQVVDFFIQLDYGEYLLKYTFY